MEYGSCLVRCRAPVEITSFSLELILDCFAVRTLPVFRNISPFCARIHSMFRIASFNVIDVTASIAYILSWTVILAD